MLVGMSSDILLRLPEVLLLLTLLCIVHAIEAVLQKCHQAAHHFWAVAHLTQATLAPK